MSIRLSEILTLVGKLDDTPGDDTPRERFRQFLAKNVTEVASLRDYVEECIRTSGDQYNRALQDLVNHIGHFLGFRVAFGRYHGVQGEIGFDGHWESPSGFHLVVEVKTTEVFATKTATLTRYVDSLISMKRIPSWDNALGLYVVGRPDPEIRQLENAIVAEKRTNQLRIASAESLLSLAEMMNAYDVEHEDILEVLRPSGPALDPVVSLMARLVAEPEDEKTLEEKVPTEETLGAGEVAYWMTPVKSDEESTAEETIRELVGEEKIYAFGERTPGRKHIKPGDWICFYATGKGVVAHARVSSSPEKKRHRRVRHRDRYPWVFDLDNTALYLDDPVVIDADLRARMPLFEGRDLSKAWAWFVQSTRRIKERDFTVLTRTHTKT